MIIGVVGNGVVGRATARAFIEHCQVRCWDIAEERCTHELAEVLAAHIVFVCLPTPATGNGPDLSPIEGFLSQASELLDAGSLFCPLLVLKSTVGVGDTERLTRSFPQLRIVHSPEFLTARCALTDAQIPARNIVGTTYPELGQELVDLYKRRFPGVPCHIMPSTASELVKLACNGYFAIKTAFFNHVFDLCMKHGMRYSVVRAAILADGRVAHAHTQVPGPDGLRGFGGACLPKDAEALSQQLGEPNMISEALRYNRSLRSDLLSSDQGTAPARVTARNPHPQPS